MPNNLHMHMKMSGDSIGRGGPDLEVVLVIVESKVSMCHCDIVQACTILADSKEECIAEPHTFFFIIRSRQYIPKTQHLVLDIVQTSQHSSENSWESAGFMFEALS